VLRLHQANRLSLYAIRHPRRVLLLAAALTLAVAPGVVRLRLRTDGHALVPADAPEVRFDRQIREQFDYRDPIVVVLRSSHPQGIFNVETLARLHDLTARLQNLEVPSAPGRVAPDASPSRNRPPSPPPAPGREHVPAERLDVMSLATERGDRVVPGTLKPRPLLDPLPTTAEELRRLRGDLEAIQLYTGSLVSSDGQAAAILVGVPPGADRLALLAAVRRVIADSGAVADASPDPSRDGSPLNPAPDLIDIIGAPVAEALLGTHILEDLGLPRALLGAASGEATRSAPDRFPRTLDEFRAWIAHHVGLVPISLAVMALVFAVSFRSVTAAALPLLEVGACLLFVFGLMGWCGVPVYLTIVVLPVILTAVGVTDEIHLFARYVQLLRERGGPPSGPYNGARPNSGPDGRGLRRVDDPPYALHLTAGDARQAIERCMEEMAAPVSLTAITTAIGFASFAFSPLGPVQAFGVFTAVGVVFCMLWSLTVIPAQLALIDPRRFVGPRRAADGPAGGAAESAFEPTRSGRFARLGAALVRHRSVVLAGGLLAAAITPFGIARVRVQDSWIDGFARSSAFRQGIDRFNDQFLGMHLLLVSVDAGHYVLSGEISAEAVEHNRVVLPASSAEHPDQLVGNRLRLYRISEGARRDSRTSEVDWLTPIESAAREADQIVLTLPRQRGSPHLGLGAAPGERIGFEITPRPMTSPDVLGRIGDFERFLRGHRREQVGGVLGTADYVSTANYLARGRAEGTRLIPPDRDGVELAWNRYQVARGQQRLRQVVDEDLARSLITVFLKDANFVDTGRLMADIRGYEAEHLRPHGITLGFAGDVAVSQRLIQDIVTTQVRSFGLALLGNMALIMLLARSIRVGLYAMVPCTLSVLTNFAVMGWTRMPLGVATTMFAGMTLGIGVDYAIHLLERYRRARSVGRTREAGILEAVVVTGPAVVVDALGVALGLAVLMLSQVPANARLGTLLVLSILGCLAWTLVLPALLSVAGRRRTTPEVHLTAEAGRA